MTDAEIVQDIRQSPDALQRVWDLSQKLGRTPLELRDMLVKNKVSLHAIGIANNSKFWDRNRAVQLRKEGYSLSEISKMIDVHKVTIRDYFRKFEIYTPKAQTASAPAQKSSKGTPQKKPTAPKELSAAPISTPAPTPTAVVGAWYGDLPARIQALLDTVQTSDSRDTKEIAKQHVLSLVNQAFEVIDK